MNPRKLREKMAATQQARGLCPLRFRIFVLVVEDPYRGGLEIVELPAADGPDEGGDAGGGHQGSDGQEDVDNAHRSPPPKVRTEYARANTVKLLMGIKTAAVKGLIAPVTANAPAMRL